MKAKKIMSNNKNIQASAVSRFFSSSLVRELAKSGRSPVFARLLVESGVGSFLSDGDTVAAAFERAFGFLKQKGFRHEYAYKAALTHKVLLGIHSLNTASMLTEFRIGRSKADVVILNGTGTVYEIKSERDSLARLERQLCDYRDVFACVNVIVGENHVDDALNAVPDDVGVLNLTGRYRISEIREAKNVPQRTKSASIFEAISLREAAMIFEELEMPVPDVPNTRRYRAYQELFRHISPKTAHCLMVSTMKKTRRLTHLAPYIERLPASLQSIALSTRLTKTDFENLFQTMHVPVSEARRWASA